VFDKNKNYGENKCRLARMRVESVTVWRQKKCDTVWGR
jgi:hypothetical protein